MIQTNEDNKMSILLVGRIYEEQAIFKLITQIVQLCSKLIKCCFYFTDAKTKNKMFAMFPQYLSIEFIPLQHEAAIDYIITVGGDGTILYAVKEFKGKAPPLVSFQRGSLGFMCRFYIGKIAEVIEKLALYHQRKIEQPFKVQKIMRLQILKYQFKQEQSSTLKVCVNQIYISRKSHQRITLQIFVNDEFLTQTAGDGLLISTPTGSTAYSLSAGGPILQNGVNGILIVPIAPNSLSFRPICLPSDCKIRVRLVKDSRSEAYVSYDGQSIEDLSRDHEIVIRKSNYDLTFFEPTKDMQSMPSWIQRLTYFLGWNEVVNCETKEEYHPEFESIKKGDQ